MWTLGRAFTCLWRCDLRTFCISSQSLSTLELFTYLGSRIITSFNLGTQCGNTRSIVKEQNQQEEVVLESEWTLRMGAGLSAAVTKCCNTKQELSRWLRLGWVAFNLLFTCSPIYRWILYLAKLLLTLLGRLRCHLQSFWPHPPLYTSRAG
jgi:hypothetical protein